MFSKRFSFPALEKMFPQVISELFLKGDAIK